MQEVLTLLHTTIPSVEAPRYALSGIKCNPENSTSISSPTSFQFSMQHLRALSSFSLPQRICGGKFFMGLPYPVISLTSLLGYVEDL